MAKPAHYGAQTKARKAALDVLFAAEQRELDPLEVLSELRTHTETTIRDYTTTLVHGVAEHQAEIDQQITDCLAARWTLARMPAIDRNLARIATFEILHTEIPSATAIAEAVRLAGDFSTDRSPAFLNGVLRSVHDQNHPTH